MNIAPKNAICGTCTIKLIASAYRKAPWFRVVREPLKLGMYLLSRLYDVNTADYVVRTPACYGCIRFYKLALKDKSAVFRWLNSAVNPVFDYCIERILPTEELQRAKSHAQAASQGSLSEREADEWMRDLKTGF